MIQKSIIICFVLFLVSNLNITLERKENNVEAITWNSIIPIQEEKEIATLTIKKINLQQKLYPKNSEQNTVEKNLAFLEESDLPDQDNGIVMIAGHSGVGKLAYFKELDKVQPLDKIELLYNKKNYSYIITQYLIQPKDGTINFNVNKEKAYLILTTCMPNIPNQQLVIIAEKEPNFS